MLLQRTAALPYCFLACEPLHGEQIGSREINAGENEGEGDASGKKGGLRRVTPLIDLI